MPHGVAKGFLRILDEDRRVAGRRVWAAAVLSVLLTVPAFFVAPPWGPLVHVAAVAVGVGVGLLVAGGVHRRYEERLRDHWEEWMDKARTSPSVPAVDRAVRGHGRGVAVGLVVVAVLLLWLAEVAALWYSFADAEDLLRALPVLVLNGMVAGTLLGHVLRRGRWSRTFRTSLDEMVADGELGIWGTR